MKPGDVVHGYTLEGHVARGGMGDVWRARRESLAGFSRTVAFKRIHPHLIAHPLQSEQFLREARIGSWLRHPCVVPVVDVGMLEDAPFLVMEFVDGLDVRRLASRASSHGVALSPALAGYIIHQTLCALEAAQGLVSPDGKPAPLVHRDISPENILVGRHGDVRVADFGLARELNGKSLTQSGTIKGKLSYMSPEQLAGTALDGRADLYAVGVTFYELLCGRRPYDANNPLHAMQCTQSPQPHPRDFDPALPSSLADLAYRWRSPVVDERGESIVHARHLLERVLADLLRGIPSSQLASRLESLTRGESLSDEKTQPPVRVTVELARRKCAKCGGNLIPEQTADGLVIDRCHDCLGVWLDAEEVRRIVGTNVRLGATDGGSGQSALDGVKGDCPVCNLPLHRIAVPGDQPFHVEHCARCRGVWFDHGELEQCLQGDASAAIRRAAGIDL